MEADDCPMSDLPLLFAQLNQLRTELRNAIDGRLRREHDLPLSAFEPMHLIALRSSCRVGGRQTLARANTTFEAELQLRLAAVLPASALRELDTSVSALLAALRRSQQPLTM
ncbi:MAG: MarR family transcriptional regulator [Conexibacter sp.]|nr:MarR family transcriptional regulator [Conexibacter sp.]